MQRGAEEFDERFTAFARSRGEHYLRMATPLTGNADAAEDLAHALFTPRPSISRFLARRGQPPSIG
jgi:hypothetical protein